MEIKPKYFYIVILLSVFNFIHSQNAQEEDIHRKYWYYKSHFNNDFIKVGLDSGESIPFNEKIAAHTNTLSPALIGNLGDAPKLHAGDGSARLGIYLSVLATEFKLLKNNNQDLTKVKHEIFCALNAINRLDLNAETFFNAPTPRNSQALNGFFVRDDIPKKFVANNYKHFNYYNKFDNSNLQDSIGLYPDSILLPSSILQDHGFTKTDLSGVYRTASSLISSRTGVKNGVIQNIYSTIQSDYNEGIHGLEESMDQAYYLLMGLTLTSKLLGASDTDNGTVFPITATPGQTSLRAEAIAIASRIITFMKNDPFYQIMNPSHKFSASPILVQTGGQPIPYCYALDNLGNFIKNNETMPHWWWPGISSSIVFPGGFAGLTNVVAQTALAYPLTPSFDFRNVTSIVSAPSYMALMNGGGGPNVDFQGFEHCLGGAGNNIYDNITIVNLGIEAIVKALNALSSALSSNLTPKKVLQLDSIVNADLPSSVSTVLHPLILGLHSAVQLGIGQLITGAISLLVDAINQIIKSYNQYLHHSLLLNVTDVRLLDNKVSNLVFYHDECLFPKVCSPPTSTTNCQEIYLTHFGSDQVFGIYLRDILHPAFASPPAGFRWLNTLAAPSHGIIQNQVKNELLAAPCNGNFNFGAGFMPPNPWGTSCFMDRFDGIWRKVTCPGSTQRGEFSGVDFMLLHNLYYLTEHPSSTGMKDYIDRSLTSNFPLTSASSSSFTTNNKNTFGAYEHIEATNTIGSNAAAILRAGKQIALLPGFEAQAGSDVDMNINPFHDCDWNTSSGFMRVAPTSNNSNTLNIKNQSIVFDKKLSAEDKKVDPEKTNDDYLVKIYPNPNEGTFNVKFNFDKMQHITISVINVLNEEVYKNEMQTINDNLLVQLPSICKGIYLVKINYENGSEFQKRIVTK